MNLRLLLVFLVVGMLCRHACMGQDVPSGDMPVPVEQPPTALEKAAWVAGASVVFAGFDYVGYNLTARNPTALVGYRIAQVLVQSAISWFLYRKLGLPSAIGFNLIWWTFGDDFLYYTWAEVINPGPPWESRGAMNNSIFGNQCYWAYWTPVGISRGMKRGETIAGDTLLAQALVGAALGFTITIAF